MWKISMILKLMHSLAFKIHEPLSNNEPELLITKIDTDKSYSLIENIHFFIYF